MYKVRYFQRAAKMLGSGEIQNYKLFIIYVSRARVRFLFTCTLRNRKQKQFII